VQELFKGRHFGREIIVLCVCWYLRWFWCKFQIWIQVKGLMNFCRNTITRSGDAFMMLSGSIAFIPRINRKEKALITEMFVELLVRNARLYSCIEIV
jgi:hypothetical protein